MATFDGGRTWKAVDHPSSPESWRYIGFTTPRQGVAVEDDGTLLMTFDGGHDWSPVEVDRKRATT